METRDFQMRLQAVVQAIASLGALIFLIAYAIHYDGAVAQELIPAFIALAGLQVADGVSQKVIHAYSTVRAIQVQAALQTATQTSTQTATQTATQTGAPPPVPQSLREG